MASLEDGFVSEGLGEALKGFSLGLLAFPHQPEQASVQRVIEPENGQSG